MPPSWLCKSAMSGPAPKSPRSPRSFEYMLSFSGTSPPKGWRWMARAVSSTLDSTSRFHAAFCSRAVLTSRTTSSRWLDVNDPLGSLLGLLGLVGTRSSSVPGPSFVGASSDLESSSDPWKTTTSSLSLDSFDLNRIRGQTACRTGRCRIRR